MNRTGRPLICTLVILMVLPAPVGLSQASPANDWQVLLRLPIGQKLSAKLKNGKTVEGELRQITDTMLSLSKHNKTTDVHRDDLAKLYRVRVKSVGKSTLKGTAIGAGAGAAVGAAVGEDCSRGAFICFDRSATIPVGAALGAIPGAATGLVIGLVRRNRQLIYESK